MARNQYNVSVWGEISIRGLLFQWASTMHIQLNIYVKQQSFTLLVNYADHINQVEE
jgi:hypothetical protein